MHMDQRRSAGRDHAPGGSLLVLRGLTPVLQEVFHVGTKTCMFLATISTCAILSLSFWTLARVNKPHYCCTSCLSGAA